jgi:hypothetical protein
MSSSQPGASSTISGRDLSLNLAPWRNRTQVISTLEPDALPLTIIDANVRRRRVNTMARNRLLLYYFPIIYRGSPMPLDAFEDPRILPADRSAVA